MERTPAELFNHQLANCVEEICEIVRSAGNRYEVMVIVAALAENLGSRLRARIQDGACEPWAVIELVKRLERIAFGSVGEKPGAATHRPGEA